MRRRAALAAMAVPAALIAGCAPTPPPSAGTAPAVPVHVVFFEDDSIALSASAQAVIQDAARIAQNMPGQPVRVLGFVAPEPGETPIVRLSRLRAQAVADALNRFGVPTGRILVQGRGAATFDSTAPVEARRVEIRIGAA